MNPDYRAVPSIATLHETRTTTTSPLLVGDIIHILNQQVYQALIIQDQKMLARLVGKQLVAGAQALAVNLGPGKEMGRLTPWVVSTIREQTGAPLFFSAGILRHRKVLQNFGPGIVINAVTANHADLARALSLAAEYGSALVVLLAGAGREKASIDDRIQLAGEVLDQALVHGLPFSRLYLDPVLTWRPDPAAWHLSRGLPDIGSAVETLTLIKQLEGGVKTIVALGNGSEGMTRVQRCGSRCRMLPLLTEAGLDAVLLNCLDPEVMRVAGSIQRGGTLYCGAAPGRQQVPPAV